MCFRGKINELSTEIGSLTKEIETIQDDQSSFVTYEKRYEQLTHLTFSTSLAHTFIKFGQTLLMSYKFIAVLSN